MDLSDINVGAELAAAGRTLGMTPDETYDFVVKKIQQQNARNARQGQPPIDERAGFRQFLDTMARVRGIDEVYPADIDTLNTVANSDLIDNRGNEIQNFGGIDINNKNQARGGIEGRREQERAEGKKNPSIITRTYFDRAGNKQTETMEIPDGMPMPERFREAAMARDFGLYRDDVMAPAQQVLRGELARLQQGVNQYGADAFPGIANVIGRIEDDLAVNRGAEASLAAELNRRDQQNVNLDVVEANDWKADAEAQRIARERFGLYGGGAQADENLGRIGNVDKIGPAKIGYDFAVNFPVPGRQVEPTSLPIGLGSDLNAPVTDNRLAGPLQKQEQWLVDHAPGYREGKVFGDYPQVAIDAQLEGVSEALAKLKIGGQGLEPSEARVRNLNDLQNAVDKVIGLGGGKFFDMVDGKNVINENPGITQVLNKARFNENQQNELARALFAIEAANRNPANQTAKQGFAAGENVRRPNAVGGAQHQLLGGGQVGVGRIGREKINGREVRAALQELDGRQADPRLNPQELRDARMPYQAAAAGEKPARAAFIKGDVRDMPRAERARRYGAKNAAIANRVEDRYLAAERARREGAPPANDRGRITPREQSIGRIVEGLQYESEFPQSATSAVVNPRESVRAIDRADVWNNASVPPAQAKREFTEPRISYNIPGQRFGQQGPRPDYVKAGKKLKGPDTSPSNRTISREADYRQAVQNYSKVRRFGRNSAIAGGAVAGLAGLDALIGGERDKRQQEEQF